MVIILPDGPFTPCGCVMFMWCICWRCPNNNRHFISLFHFVLARQGVDNTVITKNCFTSEIYCLLLFQSCNANFMIYTLAQLATAQAEPYCQTLKYKNGLLDNCFISQFAVYTDLWNLLTVKNVHRGQMWRFTWCLKKL